MENIFSKEITDGLVHRIEQLTNETERKWGKMTVGQMLAHCNVSYEMVYSDKHPKPNAFIRFILKLLVKNKVVNDVPYKKNGKTAPQFLMKDEKDFEQEKKRLIAYIQQTQELGESHFDNKESHSFGKLSTQEWNNLFYKHLDHHLTQFGV